MLFYQRTPSSFEGKNDLDPDSAQYVISVVVELLKEKYQYFTVSLETVWRNKYAK